MKNIYIVVSDPGSIVSRIIRRCTGDEYSHASISLDENLNSMYSFGRRFTNFPFPGGFVRESPFYGAFKKFRMANIVIVKLSVSDEKFIEINDYIQNMYQNKKQYHYNYIGLFLAKRGVHFRRDNSYYCSEFVKDLLERFNIVDKDEFKEVVRPRELINVSGGKIIYRGKLCEYVGT